MSISILKSCVKCKQEKTLDQFYKQSKSKDGHQNRCKSCAKAISYDRYEDKKDYLITQVKQYQKTNKDFVARYKNDYYKKNPIQHIKKLLRNQLYRLTKLKSPVGCSNNSLKKHLETQFSGEISWENYNKVWKVDRKNPITSFNLNDQSEVLKINHFSNLIITIIKNK